jgi:hypothetical protein
LAVLFNAITFSSLNLQNGKEEQTNQVGLERLKLKEARKMALTRKIEGLK